jgi:three-Cys-motif partner protein
MAKTKSDDEFFQESLKFFNENGKILQKINPEITDQYNDHSLLKLICINYWVGIFIPIAHRQLREKYGYKIAYVDTMAGSGVTSTKRENDYFCGSCPGALLTAMKHGMPFDYLFGVEIDKDRATVLENILKSISSDTQTQIFATDISEVSTSIADKIRKNTISYIVIDPEGFKGITWSNIGPLLCCKGDAMITWFEDDIWRLKKAAMGDHKAAKSQGERLTDILGDENWKKADKPSDITNQFIARILSQCNKTHSAKVTIPRVAGNFEMILFTGKFNDAEKLSKEWETNVTRRISSAYGKEIASLLDVKSGRTSSLKEWID